MKSEQFDAKQNKKKYLPAFLLDFGNKPCVCLIKVNNNKYFELNIFSLKRFKLLKMYAHNTTSYHELDYFLKVNILTYICM